VPSVLPGHAGIIVDVHAVISVVGTVIVVVVAENLPFHQPGRFLLRWGNGCRDG
jgi:hypothetical protein